MWLMLTLEIDAHTDAICKFGTGANEVVLCGASMSGMSYVGAENIYLFTNRRIARCTTVLLVGMMYYAYYSCN